MSGGYRHLVLGDIAAGVLHEGMDRGAVPATPVLRFRDIYCVGPLMALGTPQGAASRAAYWRRLIPLAPPELAEFDEEELRYRELRTHAATEQLCAWVGAHSSAQLWLQRLCSELPPGPVELSIVETVDATGRRSPGQFEPAELGRLHRQARLLEPTRQARLARAWDRNRRRDSGLRCWQRGRISHHPDDYYDGLLLAQCDCDWQPASRVIGAAMWDCDELLGDLFFAWRLSVLAGRRRLLWRGPESCPERSEVRLPSPRGTGAVH